MDIRNQPLLPGYYYHIYNCAVGNEKLFRSRDNYFFFLNKTTQYLLPVCDILSYCLLPNHFHLFIHIKDESQLQAFAKTIRKKKTDFPVLASEQFANFFNSYTKSYNSFFNRSGKLFDLPFKRIEVKTDLYFTTIIIYIHRNPVHHGFVQQFTDWEFSSYKSFMTDTPTRLARQEVLDWFGNRDAFIKAHEGGLAGFKEQQFFLE
jgi:putative transposase